MMISTRRDAQKREERACTPARLHTGTPNDPNSTRLQAPGQLRRAAQLDEQADRLQADGAYPAARRARHQANQLRRLAAGPRSQSPVFDAERVLLAVQLGRWAGRGAA